MATVTGHPSTVTVLHGVPYKVDSRMTQLRANRPRRMAYHDGVLEIASPKMPGHEFPSARIALVVTTVADRLGTRYKATHRLTFSKVGDGPFKGKGKEPDQSFYFASADRMPQDGAPAHDTGDPRPDLWIEVENRVSSAGHLPVSAALGVPEVWCHRARRNRLEFLRLVGETCRPIERSLSLPVLTPSLVLEALALGEGLIDSDWARLLREWVVRAIPLPEASA